MQVKFTNGNKEFTVKLEEMEIQYFIEFAMVELLKRGALSLEEVSEDEAQVHYLKNCDVNSIPAA